MKINNKNKTNKIQDLISAAIYINLNKNKK